MFPEMPFVVNLQSLTWHVLEVLGGQCLSAFPQDVEILLHRIWLCMCRKKNLRDSEWRKQQLLLQERPKQQIGCHQTLEVRSDLHSFTGKCCLCPAIHESISIQELVIFSRSVCQKPNTVKNKSLTQVCSFAQTAFHCVTVIVIMCSPYVTDSFYNQVYSSG